MYTSAAMVVFFCKFLIILFMSSSFVALITHSSGSSLPIHNFVSCLTHHNVYNFTLSPDTVYDHSSDAYYLNYYKLLKFSIQNLRFTESSIPKPVAIVFPENADQVASTVLCITNESMELRVRCGGHSYEGTSSFSNDGAAFVIIDMSNLNKVSVDLESETAWVQGGATLGETYLAIAEASNVHGFSAGSCPTVGVGGHIGGGGFGLLSRKYGVAADNVVDALLIDANGRLLDREGMGEDVFWAIRGGGGGVWGIVYAWKIKLLQVPRAVTAFVVSRPGRKQNLAKLVNKWQHVAPNMTDEFYLSCFLGAGLPETRTPGLSATFKGFYLGTKHEALSILNKDFPELGVSGKDCKEMSWIESILFFSGIGGGSSISDLKNRYFTDKNYFKAKSDYVTNPVSVAAITTALEILDEEPKGYVILDPYGGIMDRIGSEEIAFPHRKGNLFTIQYLVAWYEEEDDDKTSEYIEWIRGFYDAMTPFVSWGPRAAYINYMDTDLGEMELVDPGSSLFPSKDAVEIARVWGEKYFLKNYDRLVKAKTIIDPNNIFTNQQAIPPMSSLSLKSYE